MAKIFKVVKYPRPRIPATKEKLLFWNRLDALFGHCQSSNVNDLSCANRNRGAQKPHPYSDNQQHRLLRMKNAGRTTPANGLKFFKPGKHPRGYKTPDSGNSSIVGSGANISGVRVNLHWLHWQKYVSKFKGMPIPISYGDTEFFEAVLTIPFHVVLDLIQTMFSKTT